MAATTSTSHTVPIEHTGVAMLAVAQHFIDKGLPAPFSIEQPICPQDREIRVGVSRTDLQTWLNSVTVIDATSRRTKTAGWESVAFYGTLPDTGVRVVVKAVRETGTGECHGGCDTGFDFCRRCDRGEICDCTYYAPDCALHGPASSRARGFHGPRRGSLTLVGGEPA